VLEYRARYKQFEYEMTSNSMITVLDPRLGFQVEDIKKVNHTEVGEGATMYVIDDYECKNLYVI